jgi:glycosyltransferase involved in cell wall biosynthesis
MIIGNAISMDSVQQPAHDNFLMNRDTESSSELMLSIVMPVFNVGPYIEEALESIVNQDFVHDYEVILIDDASTDASLAVCREYAAERNDIIHLLESAENAGVSVARNRGLDHARGKYLMFVDPDDVLPLTALSDLFDAAEQYHADIVKGNLLLFDHKSQRHAPDRVHRTRLVTNDNVLTSLYDHSAVRGHVGGKMFRRDKLGHIRFTAGVRMAEDLLYFSQMFAAAESLVLLDRDVYRYRKHPTGSIGRKYEKGSYIDWMDAVEQSGKFASGSAQFRAHRSLLLRTMTQIARECRKIDPVSATSVLGVIEEKCEQWNI